jgi:hypothetical protein
MYASISASNWSYWRRSYSQPGLPLKTKQGGFIHPIPRQQHNHPIYLPLQPPNKQDKQIEESKSDAAHLRKEAPPHPATTTRICKFLYGQLIHNSCYLNWLPCMHLLLLFNILAQEQNMVSWSSRARLLDDQLCSTRGDGESERLPDLVIRQGANELQRQQLLCFITMDG